MIQKDFAEHWEDQIDETLIVPDSAPEGDWPDEAFRFMTVDVQKDHFYFVIRAWAKDCSSRLIDHGRVSTVEDILQTSESHKLKPHLVFIDSGFMADTVYIWCIKYGWTAVKGEDRENYMHVVQNKRLWRLYSTPSQADPGIGTAAQGRKFANLFKFASPGLKDITERLRDGNGADWRINEKAKADKAYLKQINAEKKAEKINKITGKVELRWIQIRKENHYWDCEYMQVGCACMAGLFSADAIAPDSAKEK